MGGARHVRHVGVGGCCLRGGGALGAFGVSGSTPGSVSGGAITTICDTRR